MKRVGKRIGDIDPFNAPIVSAPGRASVRLETLFSFAAVALGILHLWAHRFDMNPDGISYLDIADAYLSGDLREGVNAYWSPFYTWLLASAMFILRPTPDWEFQVVHLVNFIIYLFTLGCFRFLILELIRAQSDRKRQLVEEENVTLPEWALVALGYSLFIWSSLELIRIARAVPDMCVAAFLYLIAGILLRIRRGSGTGLTFALLGAVLGLAFLAKAAMFPLAFVLLAVSLFSFGNFRAALPRFFIALAVFLVIASPFIFALSVMKGRLTFGDAGKLNYAWFVNQVKRSHWEGEGSNGQPKYPIRKILDRPPIYEFAVSNRSTYPLWYDPSYWYEGITIRFELKKQLAVLAKNIMIYFQEFFYGLQSVLILGFAVLYSLSRRGSYRLTDLFEYWVLLIPAFAALGMYSLVYVEPRYIAGFLVLLWLGVASGTRLPESPESKKLLASVAMSLVGIIMLAVCASATDEAYRAARSIIKRQDAPRHEHWDVANHLHQLGVHPGDKVAHIGWSFGAYWARLAKVQIVAEIPSFYHDAFYDWGDAVLRSQMIKAFASTGAKVVIGSPPRFVSDNGWRRIGNTTYYVYFLRDDPPLNHARVGEKDL